MSSRTRREREGHSKRDGRERRRHTETGNRHERHSESIPRSYNDGTDSFFSPADGDLAGTMARLEVDPNSRGKGKGKQEEPAWSGWTWSDQRSCYYRARLKQSGEYEYEFSEAYTTAPGSVSGSQEASVSPTPQHSQSYSSEAQEEPPTRHPAESHHTLQTGTYPLGDSSHDDREYDSTGRSSVYNAEDNPSAGGPSEYYPPGHPGYPPASSSYLSASSSYPPTSSDTSSTYPPSGYTSPQHYQSGSTAASTAYSGSYDSGYPMTGRSMGSYSMSYGLGSQWPDDQFPPVFVPPPDCDCDPKRPGEKLCGVIIWPEQPTPDDGKVTDDPYQSSRPTATEKLVVRGPSGQNCGPLVMPGITPGPRPPMPARDAPRTVRKAYEKEDAKWLEEHAQWSRITCPCGFGYFDSKGVWISGGEAQAGNFNPLWAENGGRAILQSEGPRGRDIDLKLRERDPPRRRHR